GSAIAGIGDVTASYDGLAHGVAAPAVTGAGGLSAAATLAYYQGSTLLPGAPVNAGSYTVVASYPRGANHDAAPGVPAAISIARAEASITVAPYSVTYNGSAHTATGSATGVGGVDLTGLLHLSGTTHTGATGAPVSDTWTFYGNDNYN